MTNVTPPGWYPDPNNTEVQRYWDGQQWLNIPPPEPAYSTSPVEHTAKHRNNKRGIIIALSAVLGFSLLAGGIGIAWKLASDNRAAVEQAEAEEAEDALVAEQEALDKAERELKEGLDEVEREFRAESVKEIEASIKEMAEGHVTDGLVEGPIIEVMCSSVGGGSTDDLDQKTTVFDCFVANKDNGDGTMSGYHYNSTMNWETGNYTYGRGAA